eukprot:6349820-Pyramimonas_sp.AAC.1
MVVSHPTSFMISACVRARPMAAAAAQEEEEEEEAEAEEEEEQEEDEEEGVRLGQPRGEESRKTKRQGGSATLQKG